MRLARLPRPLAGDVALAAASAVIEVTSAAVRSRDQGHPVTVFSTVLLIAGCVPLAWRRQAQVTVMLLTGGLSAWYGIAPYPDPILQLAPLIAFATIIELADRRQTIIALVLTALAIFFSVRFANNTDATDYYQNALVFALAGAIGFVMQSRRHLLEAAEERNAQLERERDAQARAIALDERRRIARELHDVVAHRVSMMVVQAEAGAATNPAAAEAFDGIADTGRAVMDELRRLLALMRDDGRPDTEPQPTFADVDARVSSVERAGLDVTLAVQGDVDHVPASVGLTAYRIVQEALTNTVRHSEAAHAWVALRVRPDHVEVRVADDGHGVNGHSLSSGHGLVGMRERVAVLGGTLAVGARDGGGFEVVATLPVAQ